MSFRKELIVVLLTIIFSASCINQDARHKYHDKFYNGDYDFDVKRMPLIKPYFAIGDPVDSSFWFCDLIRKDIPFTYSAEGEYFYVCKDFIVLTCINVCYYNNNLTDSVFCLMVPKDTLEFLYNSKAQVIRKIDSLFGEKDFKLERINSIYKSYHKTGRLPWLNDSI